MIGRHIAPGDMTTSLTPVPMLRITRSHITTEPIAHVFEPVLAVVAQGEKRIVLGDRIFSYGIGQYLIVSVDLPVRSHIVSATKEKPFFAIGLTLKPAAIASVLLEVATAEPAAVGLAGIGVSDAPADLLDPILRLVRLLDSPRDIPVLLPGIEREILWRLLNGEQGAIVRQVGFADSRLSQISHSIRWIRTHFAEALSVDDLASQAQMSLSTFHRHFRAVTTMTPIQYQKQVRLQEARARLIADAEDVASVGFSVGYDSPSQFSREYSRFFGSPPGRDAARLRMISLPDTAQSSVLSY
ncbi:AraC-like DNA-binding protein [Rhizobium sp. BK376]|nr:AraC-like DNA-binding protein [Rhizobium sp. BK376]